MDELEHKLQSALDEEEKHFQRFFSASEKLKHFAPFTLETLEDEDAVEHLDQLTWRFVKIQDSIGRRLVPYIVEYISDSTDGMNFRDMLNKLEKQDLISPSKWNEYRILRNDITHIYPDDEKLLDTLNEIYNRKDELYNIYLTLKEFR